MKGGQALTPSLSTPRKPKPCPVISAKVEAFDLIVNDFSDDYSGLKDYVILPSRDRGDSDSLSSDLSQSKRQDSAAISSPPRRLPQ